jgi:2,5-dichlorohydroquinone reductive dechlorinase
MTDALETIVAGARQALDSAGEMRGAAASQTPRYELFHAANSICSQKVRVVLAQHGIAYLSHGVNLFLGQTLVPGYVRLRMAGCERFGGALMAHHTGSSSASAGGCDGAVVPTLVDWQAGEVVVDSLRICRYLDDQVTGPTRLRPDHLAMAIDAELAIVDNVPNYQMLMGRPHSASQAAAAPGATSGALSQRKVALCDRYMAEYADDAILVQAYAAKRAKELSAASELFSAAAMQDAYRRAEQSLHVLEQTLRRGGTRFLFGQDVTMADLFWGVQLLRMQNVGVASFWEGGRLPRVAAYCAATAALAAIRSSVLEWPGAMF